MKLWPVAFAGTALWLIWQAAIELAELNRSLKSVQRHGISVRLEEGMPTYSEPPATVNVALLESIKSLTSGVERLTIQIEDAACMSAGGNLEWSALPNGRSIGYCRRIGESDTLMLMHSVERLTEATKELACVNSGGRWSLETCR